MRITKIWTLAALLAAGGTAPANARDLCTALIDGGNDSLMAALSYNSGGIVQMAKEGGPEKIRARAQAEFGANSHPVLFPLGDDAVAAQVIEGTAHCQSLRFYDHAKTDPRAVKSPWIGPTCANAGPAAIATIAGTAALINSSTSDLRETVLRINGWEDHHWTTPCEISVRFGTKLAIETAYCKDADCNALGKTALVLGNKYSARPLTGTANAFGDAQTRVLAAEKGAPALNRLPTLGMPERNRFLDLSYQTVTPVTINGEAFIALAGRGSAGSYFYEGYLVAFWRRKDGVLQPVAGYQLAQTRGKLLSVRTRPK